MALATTTIVAIAALATTAYATEQNMEAQADQQRAQKNARLTQQAQSQVQQQQAARQQARERRVREAQILQSSQNTGTAGSSGELGGISSLTSQVAGNISTLRGNQFTSNGLSGFAQDAANAQGQQATWGAIGGISSSIFNISAGTTGTQRDINSLFGSNPAKQQNNIQPLGT